MWRYAFGGILASVNPGGYDLYNSYYYYYMTATITNSISTNNKPSFTLPFVHTHTFHTSHLTQINKRGKVQERSLLVTDTVIFKLDPRKHYQRKKSPLQLSQVVGVSVSPALDQSFVVHFSNMKDLVFYMINPQNDNRVAELVAVLCQICQR